LITYEVLSQVSFFFVSKNTRLLPVCSEIRGNLDGAVDSKYNEPQIFILTFG